MANAEPMMFNEPTQSEFCDGPVASCILDNDEDLTADAGLEIESSASGRSPGTRRFGALKDQIAIAEGFNERFDEPLPADELRQWDAG